MLWCEPEPRDTLDDFLAKIALPLSDHFSNSNMAHNLEKFLGGFTETIEMISRLKDTPPVDTDDL